MRHPTACSSTTRLCATIVRQYSVAQYLSLQSNLKHGWFAKVREPHLNPLGSYELSWLFPCKQGREAESSYEPEGSDVVRELSREPAMFQIGLQGEVTSRA